MLPPLSYPEMIRQVKNPYDLRLRLVCSAREIGIKPTARLLGTSPQTVRLWVRRFAAQGRRGLASRSHAPKSCPHRTSGRLEARIVRLRTQTGFGAKRLKVEFELPVSEGAIARASWGRIRSTLGSAWMASRPRAGATGPAGAE